MSAAVLWLAADLVPWIAGAAGTTCGLLAFGIERIHRHRADQRAQRAEHALAQAREGWSRAHREGWAAAVQALAADQDAAVLARHHTAAASEGLLPPERLN